MCIHYDDLVSGSFHSTVKLREVQKGKCIISGYIIIVHL